MEEKGKLLTSKSFQNRVMPDIPDGEDGETRDTLTSTILVNNIHCASCVRHIDEILSSLDPKPFSISSSIVTQHVKVQHSPNLALRSIVGQLNEAGFEVHGAVTEDGNGHKIAEVDFSNDQTSAWLEQAVDRWSKGGASSRRQSSGARPRRSFSLEFLRREKRKRHVDHCAVCQAEERAQNEKKRTLPGGPGRHPSRNSKWEFGPPKVSEESEESSKTTLAVKSPTQPATVESASQNSGQFYDLKTIEEGLAPSPAPASDKVASDQTAIYAIGGMTCSSCTNTITDKVKELDYVRSVDVSLLTNSATVTFAGSHDTAEEIQDHIKDAGYECIIQESSPAPSNSNAAQTSAVPKTNTGSWQASFSIAGMTCASCANSISEAIKKAEWVKTVDVNLLSNSATVVFEGDKEKTNDINGMIDDVGFDSSLQNVVSVPTKSSGSFSSPESRKPLAFKAILSIQGMTCASCTGTVDAVVRALDFVKDINVSLLTNSATVTFFRKEHANEIVSAIEDAGYDCTIEQITIDSEALHSDTESQRRSIMIKVDGMFCEHCPTRVLEAIDSVSGGDIVVKTPLTSKNPIITLEYSPAPPKMTIRNIVAAIGQANSAFKVSIYKHPTIEDRSRAMQRHERSRILQRLLLSAIVAIPTLLIGVVWMSLVPSTNHTRMYFEQTIWSGSATRADWALLFLATPVMFFSADLFHVRALKEIKALWRPGSRTPLLRRFYRFGSMNLLLSAGTSVAYFSSLAVVIVKATMRSGDKRHEGDTTYNYFDAVVFLTMFILIGRYLEAFSKARTDDAVTMLGNLRPAEALLITPSDVPSSPSKADQPPAGEQNGRVVASELLEVGDIIRIPPGASPPSDGLITDGSSSFDESSLTGESVPVRKDLGDEVYAGTINKVQAVSMQITGAAGKSMLDQIVKVVREGQAKRAPMERFADVITGYFVPVITLIAIITFVIWISLGQGGALPESWRTNDTGGWPFWALQFAIAVFVVACPCGIGLAAPTALFVGSGLAAKNGILVKGGGEAFQEASTLDAVVFDKTGTLTEDTALLVSDHDVFVTRDSFEEDAIWTLTLALESSSSHPLARTLDSFASSKRHLPVTPVSDVTEVSGLGLRGSFTIVNPSDSKPVTYEAAIGSEALMSSLDIELSYYERVRIHQYQDSGASIALLAYRRIADGQDLAPFSLTAAFAITTPVRPTAISTIATLREAGLSVYMLTGDNAKTAHAVGAQVGLGPSEIISNVLPNQKAAEIRRLQTTLSRKPGRWSVRKNIKGESPAIVAMVGDGINDAPALAAADVSISVGSGTSVAISASKFVLVASDLHAIPLLIDLSRTVFRRVRVNFAWALVYNCALVPIAAGILMGIRGRTGTGGVRISPVWASAAMAASSVSVVCSSLALRWEVPVLGWRPKRPAK